MRVSEVSRTWRNPNTMAPTRWPHYRIFSVECRADLWWLLFHWISGGRCWRRYHWLTKDAWVLRKELVSAWQLSRKWDGLSQKVRSRREPFRWYGKTEKMDVMANRCLTANMPSAILTWVSQPGEFYLLRKTNVIYFMMLHSKALQLLPSIASLRAE